MSDNDMIRRGDAKRLLTEWFYGDDDSKTPNDIIDALPAVQPEPYVSDTLKRFISDPQPETGNICAALKGGS